MRQWRVGSFSLGIALILIGLAVAFEWTGNAKVGVFGLLRWWPAVLILLGLEIVIAGFLAGQGQPRLKYDWVGVIAIIMIVGASICLEAVNVTGFLAETHRAIASTRYTMLEFPANSIPVESGVTRAVVTCGAGSVEVRTSSSDSIVVSGSGSVTAESEAAALAWAAEYRVVSRREGDVSYISFETPPIKSGLRNVASEARWVVLVPDGLHLDLSASSNVDVVARGLSADWLVAASGPMSVTLGADEDLKVIGRTRSHSSIGGNITWTDVDDKTAASSDGENHTLTSVQYNGDWVVRGATLGRGSHTLQIRATGDVLVEVPVVSGE